MKLFLDERYSVESIKPMNATKGRLSDTIERLLQRDPLFQKLDTIDRVQQIAAMLEEDYSPDELDAIADRELEEIVDFTLALETVSGTLNDLTPEQIEQFEAAVTGR